MRLTFTAEQLNFGKLLVLEKNHDLKLAEIKRLIGATSVRELKSGKQIATVDEYMQDIIGTAASQVSLHRINDIRLYEVHGDVKSAMLAMRTDKLICAVQLSGEQLNQLNYNSDLMYKINKVRYHIGMSEKMSSALMVEFSANQQLIKKFSAKSKAINALAANYGIAEIEKLKSSIRAMMKSKW